MEADAKIVARFPTVDHHSDGTIRAPCGCWFEKFAGCIALGHKTPIPARARFTDNAIYLKHHCEKHWTERIE